MCIVHSFGQVEVCRPWATLPQWSTVVDGMLAGLASVGLNGPTPTEVDVVSHSYGTAVANRLGGISLDRLSRSCAVLLYTC